MLKPRAIGCLIGVLLSFTSVGVGATPQRIVSLAPSLTEILFSLGLDDEIVAVTDFCDYPPQAKRKPSVGAYSKPNLERIIALNPDLICATQDGNDPQTIEHLRRLGYRVLVTQADSVDTVLAVIRSIGEATGRDAQAQHLVEELRSAIQAILERGRERPRRKAVFIVEHEPLIACSPNTLAGELLALAGGENIVQHGLMRYPRLNIEAILREQPEVIVEASGHTDIEASHAFWDRWPQIPAVRSGRIYVISADIVLRPGPRIIDGLKTLSAILHAEMTARGR